MMKAETPKDKEKSMLESASTITVMGRGSATAAPDHFTINIAIEAQRPTVKEAYAAATEAMNAVQQTLLELDVARESVGSSALDVRAESRWQDGVGSIVTGYTVWSNLSVLLRYDSAAQDVIAAVVTTGNNSIRLNGLTPAITDPSTPQDEARTAAFADARRAATLYAVLAGKSLGAVVSIAEGQVHSGGPAPVMARAMMASADSAMKIEPGQTTLEATVTVTWALV